MPTCWPCSDGCVGVSPGPCPVRPVRAAAIAEIRRNRRDADRDRTDDGKSRSRQVSPTQHGVLHDAMGRVIARDRRRRDEGKRNDDAQPERPGEGKEQLADAENQPGRDQADGELPGQARAGAVPACNDRVTPAKAGSA